MKKQIYWIKIIIYFLVSAGLLSLMDYLNSLHISDFILLLNGLVFMYTGVQFIYFTLTSYSNNKYNKMNGL